MCGICGIINYNTGNDINEGLIQKMCKEMEHRGPDDEGKYLYKKNVAVTLGHRRLSIIDLSSAGHQPMPNEDSTVWIVLNGEIYNHKELRLDLENKGHKFKSYTDTEVVIHLYEEFGEDCVKYIRGMFAFAIWDEKEETLFLARDRVGKKPLIYSYNNGIFCFASEFKSILASGFISKEINYEAIHYYLTFGYIPAPLTIYKNVFKLPPAHILTLKDKKLEIKKYWELSYEDKIDISEKEAAEEVLRLLKEAVKIRMYSDVPLGAFLSGGIDSSTVVGLMSEFSNKKVRTFSVGFDEESYSELKYARNIAKRFNTEHNEFIVKPNALDILPLLVERYGEPYADSSCIPSYYVSRETKNYVTVALNGDGGDESFAGYERYQAMMLAEKYRKLPDILKKHLSQAVKKYSSYFTGTKSRIADLKRFFSAADYPIKERYFSWISIFDANLKRSIYADGFKNIDTSIVLNKYLNDSNELNLIDKLLLTDINTYLPGDLLVKMDIASMANSLEARSPFLDHKLMEFAAKLPAEYKMKKLVKKYILKKAIKDLVPRENINRRKMGFGVPIGEWFRKDLKNFLINTILSDKSLNRGYFKRDAAKNMVYSHIERKADYSHQLWALLMLELWHQRFID